MLGKTKYLANMQIHDASQWKYQNKSLAKWSSFVHGLYNYYYLIFRFTFNIKI